MSPFHRGWLGQVLDVIRRCRPPLPRAMVAGLDSPRMHPAGQLQKYFKKYKKLNIYAELELGVTLSTNEEINHWDCTLHLN